MLLLVPDKQNTRLFSIEETLVLDPISNPDLTIELYEEMLEFERELYDIDHQDILASIPPG